MDLLKRFSALLRVSFIGAIPLITCAGESSTQDAEKISGTPFHKYHVHDSENRKITYYLSTPGQNPAPILLMIQGSGCTPVLTEHPSGTYSSLFNLLPFAEEGNFAVLAVEKPYSGHKQGTNTFSVEESCSTNFHQDFTAESWLLALATSLTDARKKKWVDNSRTLILGISEGATMAALLASRDSTVTDVISIGGSGTTQLFDMVALAYKRCFDVSTCLEEINNQVKSIQQDPDSFTRFAWGHPYKRWSSFFPVDPSNALINSKARAYIAFGTADESTPALSLEVAVARLTAAGKDITTRRIPDAGHHLMKDENPDLSLLDSELRRGLEWFFKK